MTTRSLFKKAFKSKRFLILSCFSICAVLLAGVFWYENSIARQNIASDISKFTSEAEQLQQTLKISTLDEQNFSQFLSNLTKEYKILQLREQARSIILKNEYLFTNAEIQNVNTQVQLDAKRSAQNKIDMTEMALSWIDYNIYRGNKNLVDAYRNLAETSIATSRAVERSLSNPTPDALRYVHTGDIIGLQGCTGICTGTHVHFVMAIDNKTVDACKYLPKLNISRWGDAAECGVSADKATISWPMYFPWIITQTFGNLSPVLHTPHGAVDLIDREYAPVLAAHDGWYLPSRVSCQYSNPCNGGAAKVVTICENRDCNIGIRTQYWHLDWMVE